MKLEKYEFKQFGIKEENIVTHENIQDNLEINESIEDKSKVIINEYIEKEEQQNLSELVDIDKLDNLKTEITEHNNINNEKIIALLTDIVEKIETISINHQDKINNICKDLASLSLHIAKKVMMKDLRENPLIEIETFLKNSIKYLKDEKNIKIYLNPNMIEAVSNKIKELSPSFNENDISFESDEKLDLFDCNISWCNGSLIFSKEEIINRIEKLF